MEEYIIEIGEHQLHIKYAYIPEQKERYPDTEPLRAHVEIDRIFYNDTEVTELMWECADDWLEIEEITIYCVNDTVYTAVDITDIMYEVADDWLIQLEAEIIEKLED
jgi:hypothetical protein